MDTDIDLRHNCGQPLDIIYCFMVLRVYISPILFNVADPMNFTYQVPSYTLRCIHTCSLSFCLSLKYKRTRIAVQILQTRYTEMTIILTSITSLYYKGSYVIPALIVPNDRRNDANLYHVYIYRYIHTYIQCLATFLLFHFLTVLQKRRRKTKGVK